MLTFLDVVGVALDVCPLVLPLLDQRQKSGVFVDVFPTLASPSALGFESSPSFEGRPLGGQIVVVGIAFLGWVGDSDPLRTHLSLRRSQFSLFLG